MNSIFLDKNYGETNFITGLRAFAALGVVLIHAGGAGLRGFGTVGNNIADLGRAGVYVFFVISGFSVSSSYIKSKSYSDYIRRRLLRIAPLYYLWLALTIVLGVTAAYWQDKFSSGITPYNLFLHVSFLSFLDYRIANSIIGVEWSIPIEVFWYFVVPLLWVACKSSFSVFAGVVLSFSLYCLCIRFPEVLPVDGQNAALAMYWSPIPYLFSYMLGVSTYHFRNRFKHSNTLGNCAVILPSILIGLYVLKPALICAVFYDQYVFVSLMSASLILFGKNEAFLIRWLFNNPVSQFFGVVSYGIYLSHLPVLRLIETFGEPILSNQTILFALISILSAGVSAVTYYFVEQRFISSATPLRSS